MDKSVKEDEESKFKSYLRSHDIEDLLQKMKISLKEKTPINPHIFLQNLIDEHSYRSSKLREKQALILNPRDNLSKKIQSKVGIASISGSSRAKTAIDKISSDDKKSHDSRFVFSIKKNVNSKSEKVLEEKNGLNANDGRTFFCFDIGGSLIKICILIPKTELLFNGYKTKDAERFCRLINDSEWGTIDDSKDVILEYGRLKFALAKIKCAEKIIHDLTKFGFLNKDTILFATGGGAYKYSDLFSNIGSIKKLEKVDELSALLHGVNFLMKTVSEEAYCFTKLNSNNSFHNAVGCPCYWNRSQTLYPYLLVNIGSGCSILKVDGPNSFQRVSGTCIGGGTYWGLVRALCSKNEFLPAQKAYKLAIGGNKTSIDMVVADIYGGDYERFRLKGDTVAAAFGKASFKNQSYEKFTTQNDIARSLLDMIGMNIAQLAYLCAKNYKTNRLVFVGNFLRHNDLTMKALAYSIHYWSGGTMEAAFLQHEGYFGACGSLIWNIQTDKGDE